MDWKSPTDDKSPFFLTEKGQIVEIGKTVAVDGEYVGMHGLLSERCLAVVNMHLRQWWASIVIPAQNTAHALYYLSTNLTWGDLL